MIKIKALHNSMIILSTYLHHAIKKALSKPKYILDAQGFFSFYLFTSAGSCEQDNKH